MPTEFVAPMLQIKVALHRPRGVELRRIRGAYSLGTLRAAVEEMWPLKDRKEGRMELVLEYEDDEGDQVRLTTDAEWMEAVRLLGESPSQAVLKLSARRKVFAANRGGDDSGVTDGGEAEPAVPDAQDFWSQRGFGGRLGRGRGCCRGRGAFMRRLLMGGSEEPAAADSSDDAAFGVGMHKRADMWGWLKKRYMMKHGGKPGRKCCEGWKCCEGQRKTEPMEQQPQDVPAEPANTKLEGVETGVPLTEASGAVAEKTGSMEEAKTEAPAKVEEVEGVKKPQGPVQEKLPEKVQTLLSVFPYLTAQEAFMSLRGARGDLGRAINSILARADQQSKFF